MKRISKRTWELIHQLYQRQSFWEKLAKQNAFPIWVLEEIAASGEARVVGQIAPFLLHKDSQVCAAAARAIGQLVRQVELSDYPQLDDSCRRGWDYDFAAEWRNLKPAELNSFQRLPDAVAILGIASFHWSGYIREAAVYQLARISDGTELPFLLLRLNDWVGVVRDAAVMLISQRLEPHYTPHFFRNLRLLLRLRDCGRKDHGQTIEAILNLLRQPSAADLLQEGIRSGDRWLRRESLQIALASNVIGHVQLVQHIKQEKDPVMRLWIARKLLPELSDAEVKPVLSILLQDRFQPVRTFSLHLFAQRFPLESREALVAALFDRHGAVRALGRYWLQRVDPQFDFAAECRSHLAAPCPKQQAGAIMGLGETGKPIDAQLIFPFLTSPMPDVRKAAVFAIAALDGDRFVGQMIAAIADEQPSVSKQAALALQPRAKVLTEELEPLFRTETRRYVRKNLFKLLASQPFWSRGIFLFSTLRDTDEEIIEMGHRALMAWLRLSGNMAIGPSDAELQELRKALNASAGMLPDAVVREFKFCLRG